MKKIMLICIILLILSGCSSMPTRTSVCSHEYSVSKLVEATCQTEGYQEFICNLCGDTYSEIIEIQEHDYEAPANVTESTCVKHGEISELCLSCGYINITPIDLVDHSFVEKSIIDEDGEESIINVCEVCCLTDIITRLEDDDSIYYHEYKEVDSKDPTCSEKGFTKSICTICNDEIIDEIDYIEHTFIENVEKTPSCTEEGTIAYLCEKCGYSENEIIPMVEHTFVDVIEKEPTCEQDGLLLHKCSNCNYNKSETISKLGHDLIEVVVEPTCTEKGYTHTACSRCDYSKNRKNETKALGHDYRVTKNVYATPSKDGYEDIKCERCGNEDRIIYEYYPVYVSRQNVIHRKSDCSGMKYYTEMDQRKAENNSNYVSDK